MKLSISKTFLCLLSISSLALTSCASYRAASLSNLSPDMVVMTKRNQDDAVTVCAKTFDSQDCKKYLDRNVIENGYYPVQLYIENNSDKDYLFSLSRVSLPCARPEEVAERVHTSTAGRAVGYGAAALLTCGLFLIPAIVDGVKSAHANQALDSDFEAKSARDHTIYQHSHSNMLMFVPVSDYQPTFSVTLIDQITSMPKTFIVSAAR